MDTLTATDATLPSGLRLALRVSGDPAAWTGAAGGESGATAAEPGAGRTFLLVHGLASNARLWDAVSTRLAAAGQHAVAVDQRGHGLSDAPADGYDSDTCADDLAALITTLGLDRPIVVGQSWGGNVVLSLAARHPDVVRAVCCVDGGWIRLADRFETFDNAWHVLEPPVMDSWRWEQIDRRIRSAMAGWPDDAAGATLANLRRTDDGGVRAHLARPHHRDIVRSLFDNDPRALMPRIQVPVLLAPAVGDDPLPGEGDQQTMTRAAVHEALALLPNGSVRWFPGAHHDLHAQQPDALVDALLRLAEVAP